MPIKPYKLPGKLIRTVECSINNVAVLCVCVCACVWYIIVALTAILKCLYNITDHYIKVFYVQ